MAVMQMDRIRLLAMKRDRKAILELLQHRGIVEVSDAPQQDDVFEKVDTSASRSLLQKNAETAARAIEILAGYSNEKKPLTSFLHGHDLVEADVDKAFVKVRETVLKVAQRVVRLDREMAEGQAEILRAEGQIEALKPWMDLPVPQTFQGTKKTAVYIGSVEGEQSLNELLNAMAQAAPGLEAVDVQIVDATKEQTCFYVVCLKKDAALAEEALRSIGFTKPAGASHHMPQEKKKSLEAQIEAARQAIEKAKEEIASYVDRMADLRYLQDHMNMRAEKYDVIQRLVQSRHVFALEGYVPQKVAGPLGEELTRKFECSVDFEKAPESDETPMLLKNNGFVEPGEVVLEGYSLPGHTDVDPTSIMTIFYYIMFGLMFSDAAYGAIIVAVTGACLLKFKNMAPNWKKNIKLFFWCGISTVFWGIVFSSYFGDLVTVISQTFFGKSVTIPPLWFAPLDNPMLLLLFCLAIGIVHLTAGYIMKAAVCIKNKQYIDVLYETVFPVALFYPLILMLLNSEMFEGMAGFRIYLPDGANTVCLIITGICAVGIVLTGGRESKSWIKRLLKGIFAFYNALTGWLSDVFSYARLMALGLATGVIGSIFNTLGSLLGTGIVGIIGFILIFAVGHALNFGINVLGAYVHSNRLEYVEFFGKFYEGGGRKFEPFGMHTKYYKIKEES